MAEIKIERIETGRRMSEAVIYGGIVYLSGQVASDENAAIGEQSRTTLETVEQLLKRCGSSKAQLLTATVYLKNIDDSAAFNEVWDSWVPEGTAPARTCVEAKLFAEEFLVEVTVTAAVQE